MASAYQFRDSGVGDKRGLDMLDATMTWVATIDAVGDDPIVPVQIESPLGMYHPQGARGQSFAGLIVVGYAKARQLTPLKWLIDVIYGSKHKSLFGGWLTEVQSGSGTEHITRDLDGKLIGPKVYVPHQLPSFPLETTEATHQTILAKPIIVVDESGVSSPTTILELTETEDVVKPVGYDRMAGPTTLIFSRTLLSMSMSIIRNVDSYKFTINHSLFADWSRGMLLFANYNIREAIGSVPYQDNPGLIYHVRLVFLINRKGWETIERFSTWIDDEGNESVIYRVDQPEEGPPALTLESETYRVFEKADFVQLLGIVAGTASKPPGRPR